MNENGIRPLVTMQVVDWEGPIVEIVFHRPIATSDDVTELLRETRGFMDQHVRPSGAQKAYFVTCYDGFRVAKEQVHPLQEAFLEFNQQYSKGDVRYGGSVVAQSLVISTAIRSLSASEIHPTREEALESLRERIRCRG